MAPDAQAIGGEVALPDGQVVPLTPEQAEAILAAQEAADLERAQQARDLMRKLEARRDEWVRGKADIEKRMVDDLRQYEGLGRIVGRSKKEQEADHVSPPRIHRTRSRTDMMEARLSDMLLTHAAWGLKPTPVPDMPADKSFNPETGEPLSDAELEIAAKDASERMSKHIADTLTESKFPSIGRRMIRDACRIGTGLLMGPMGAIRYKRTFNTVEGQATLDIVEEPRAEVRYGDPWCFYPELASSADKAQGAFYLHLMSRAELQEFAKHPKVDTKAIARVLKQEPDLGEVGRNLAYRNQYSPYREETSGRYAVWRYTGILEREEAECLGLIEAEEQSEPDELMSMPMADMWFCQGEVFRSKTSPFECDYRIPYYVYAPFPADDSMFGLSLPYHCRDSQRAADAAYQAMLHNAAVSSGPLIFGRREAFQAAKGDTMEVNGPRWFWITDPDMKVGDCVDVVNFPNNSEQAAAILDRVLEILDDELNMPQIVGDVSASKPLTQTASGMAMLLNQMLTVMQRRAASAFDDDVILPLIQRLYWWEMLYGDDEAAKGDYQVEPLGQNVLLVKDIRVQHLMMYLQLTEGDPEVNASAIKAEIAKMLDIPDDRFKRTPEEIAEIQANQPPDPDVQKAQAAQSQADAATQRAQTEAERAASAERMHMADLQDRREERIAKLTMMEAQLGIEGNKLLSSEATEMEKIAARERMEQYKNQIAETRLGAETRLKAEQLASKERETQAEIAVEAPNVRLA